MIRCSKVKKEMINEGCNRDSDPGQLTAGRTPAPLSRLREFGNSETYERRLRHHVEQRISQRIGLE